MIAAAVGQASRLPRFMPVPDERCPRRALAEPAHAGAALMLALGLALALAAQAPPRRATTAQLEQAAKTAVAVGEAGPARQALAAALRRDPNWKEGLWDFGTLLYEAHDAAGARQAFGRLTELDPKHGAPWAMLGLCDFEARDFSMSVTHLQEGRSLGLSNANLKDVALYDEAQDLIILGEYPQASHLLKRFALRHRSSPGIVAAFGLAALHLPLLPEQLGHILSPRRRRLVQAMGTEMYDLESRNQAGAQKVMAGILRTHPHAPYVQYNDGLLLLRLGEIPAAEAAFRRELAIQPNNVPARLQLAALYQQNARYPPALSYARQALRLAPANFATHYMVGLILYRQGQFAAAAHELERSKALAPEDSQVRYALAQVDLKLHRDQAALREEKAFRRLEQLSSSFRNQGVLPASVYQPAAPHSGTP
ncbi:MAG: tetratricopeptide repeat protein [Terriglobales bacterium]